MKTRQILALFLAVVGLCGTILICALPMWKVSAFVGANIVTAQVFWEGLWMNCVLQSTGQMQCKAYDSVLALSQDLQGARALICASIGVCVLAIGLTVVGADCTNFYSYEPFTKAKIGITAGSVYIVAGVMCLIAVSWSAYVIIVDFYNPQASGTKGELGASVYIGWVAGVLLIVGGGLLISTYSNRYPCADLSKSDKALVQMNDDVFSCLMHCFTTPRLHYWISKQRSVENIPIVSECVVVEYDSAHTKIMASAGIQILAKALAVIGWLGTIIICALPMWKVTAFIGNNIVTAQIFWEGLWMNCVQQSTGQMQCKVYDSMLALPQDLQAARALVVISILVALLGMLLAVAGGKCTNCIEDGDAKAKVCVAAGVFFLVAAVLCLIPVCWCANAVIRDFYNPIVTEAQKRELGASLFIGWGSSGLLLIGGALLCCQCPKNDGRGGGYSAKYSAPRSAANGGAYGARALVIIAIIAGVFGIILCIVGGKCTNFVDDEASKAKVAIASGIIFIIAGLLVLIPVCWTANAIIRDFYNPLLVDGQRRELGESLYVGWASAALLFLGGGLLCSSCPPSNDGYPSVKYSQARSVNSSKAYV
ncbi:uncharacterized protein [Paramisgurnus dabryanus]|uniref:uncharacterized protein n=1 Tax=Paramisgurnus dabryanus TaxID=90735 RepID=UPI0031F41FD8